LASNASFKNQREVINIRTGERQPYTRPSQDLIKTISGGAELRLLPDHYRMYQPNGALLFLANEYVVVDPSGMPQFRFDALWAQPAGLGEIVVEALPTDEAIVKNGPIQPG